MDTLKQILENLRTPERLDSHPWVESLTVREAVEQNPALASKSPGAQLALALGELFRQMLPATPPQDGKRLDTRWGRFGILAANYFAPLLYGRLYPRSQREAWRRIDQAIFLFVYGKTEQQLTPEQAHPYRLVGDEMDLAANSTISDWHRSGLEELTDLFINHETHLSLTRGEPSPVLSQGINDNDKPALLHHPSPPSRNQRTRYWVALAIGLLLVAGVSGAGLKVRQMLALVDSVRADIAALDAVDLASVESADVEQVGALLSQTKQDLAELQTQVTPWLWLTSRLGWVPVYGGDLKSAGDLLEMASASIEAAGKTYQTAFPIWQAVKGTGRHVTAPELTTMLLETKPSLLEAQADLLRARQARQRIDLQGLSPQTQALVARLDPYLTMLDEAISLSLSLPGLLGGAEEGPKTYLVLVQNEDELRPTGGFISAVGKIVVFKGQLVSWNVEDSYAVDDKEKIYPQAPWQMRSFMNIPVFVFRDANWYTDYPTTVIWTEYLYAFTNSFSVDGVIAIDQHVLASILSVTGPLYIPEIKTTVSAENVREVMRAQKIPPPEAERDPDWHRKQFMQPIANAILDRVLSGGGFSWETFLRAMLADLDQRHILVQLDDPALTALLAERGWDGAVRNEGGDFLMVVDTNVGYNKTNAVVSSGLTYDVDLTDPSTPVSNLVVSHKNDACGQMGEHCDERPTSLDATALDSWYAIDRCYYNYLRVYVPAGAQLLDATPHAVTREDMIMLDQDVPARVDLLNEILTNIQGFGTLFVLPMGQSLQTSFKFNLPAGILQPGADANESLYRLKIQKQAGIVSMPVTVRVHLPAGAEIKSVFPTGLQDGRNVLFELELREDILIEIVFRP